MEKDRSNYTRNKEILEDRNFRKMTHRQIAEKHNISYSRVKQILDTLEKKNKYYSKKQ